MELSSPLLFWNICCFVIGFGRQDQPLNVHPTEIFIGETFLFFSLSLIVFQEQNTNEKVEEEEAADQDEQYKVYHQLWRIIVGWSFIPSGKVKCKEHNIWPALKTRNNKQSHHRLGNVVEVVVLV